MFGRGRPQNTNNPPRALQVRVLDSSVMYVVHPEVLERLQDRVKALEDRISELPKPGSPKIKK